MQEVNLVIVQTAEGKREGREGAKSAKKTKGKPQIEKITQIQKGAVQDQVTARTWSLPLAAPFCEECHEMLKSSGLPTH